MKTKLVIETQTADMIIDDPEKNVAFCLATERRSVEHGRIAEHGIPP